MRGRGALLVVAVLVLVAAATGCSRDPERLDTGTAEQQISQAVAKTVAPPVVDVRCPQHIPLGPDRRFHCDVVLGDPSGTLPVTAIQRDDAGTIEVVPDRPVLSDHQIAEALRVQLRQQFHRSFQTDCGKAASKVRRPGEQLICRARDQMTRRSVVVTIEDAAGTLSFQIVDP